MRAAVSWQIKTNLKVELRSDLLDFQLKGEKFYTPNLELDVKACTCPPRPAPPWPLHEAPLPVGRPPPYLPHRTST